MSLNPSQKVFMRTIVNVSADIKIKHNEINSFFNSIAELSKEYQPQTNPLSIRGKSQLYIMSLYLEQIKQYIFHLATIYKTTAIGEFDTHNNKDIRRTYIEQICEFIKVFPEPVCEKLAEITI